MDDEVDLIKLVDDEADLKKILDVIKSTREEDPDDFQYQDFINFEDSDEEEIDESFTDDFDLDKPITLDISTAYKYNPISSLKSEEKAVIDSAEDPDLKQLLLLNRQKNIQLILLYKKFKDLLIECKQNILEKKEIIKQYYEAYKVNKQSSGSWRVCAPYFKDKDFYVCPPNSDLIKKKNAKELSYYDLMPLKTWTKFECDRLVKAVKVNYSCNVSLQLKKSIRMIENREAIEQDGQQLKEMKARLKKLSNSDTLEIPPLGSDENINWIRVAEVFIQDKHSDLECRSFWHMFLHPSINRSNWKKDENEQLQKLVHKYKCQEWDKIVSELGTNRTCFIAAKHYFTNIYNAHKKGEFTVDEDKKLLDLINKYRMGEHIPWVRIARDFKNRTRSQLHHRFTYYLSQYDKKRGKFSESEDVMILLVVERYGVNFRKCTEFLPQRSFNQIKSRYSSNLRGLLIKGLWTVEDDKIILDYATTNKANQSWTPIALQLKRSCGQVRQRYNIIKNFLSKNPESTVKDVPRRKHKHKLLQEDRYNLVRKMADYFLEQYQDSIPTLEEIEEKLEQNRSEPDLIHTEINQDTKLKFGESSDVDELLTEFFCNSYNQPIKALDSNNLKQTVDNVEILLDLLKVDLDIPDNLSNKDLDDVDLEILEELKKRNNLKSSSKEITRLVPPSFHNTTAMRGMLIKYLDYKNENIITKKKLPLKNDRISIDFDIHPVSSQKFQNLIDEELVSMSESERQKLQADRDLFYQRFVSLFKWPAVLTLEPPTREFFSIAQSITNEYKPAIKRTYGKQKGTVQHPSKVRILEDSAKQSLKLTPVTDNSVIVNLLKDNTKKLFFMDQVQCGNQTKTLIKEVDLALLPRNEPPKKSLLKTYTSSVKNTENSDNRISHETPGTSKSIDIEDQTSSLNTSVLIKHAIPSTSKFVDIEGQTSSLNTSVLIKHVIPSTSKFIDIEDQTSSLNTSVVIKNAIPSTSKSVDIEDQNSSLNKYVIMNRAIPGTSKSVDIEDPGSSLNTSVMLSDCEDEDVLDLKKLTDFIKKEKGYH